MDLQREPDPKPAPPEATGAVVEKKKIKVVAAAALAVGLVSASFIGWLFRPHSVVDQRPMQQLPGATVPQKQTRLNESAELAYEQHKRDDFRNNPAFNVGDNSAEGVRTTAQPTANLQSVAQKRTPEDDYKDLLQKAALADSTVEGAKASTQGTRLPPDLPQQTPGAQQQRPESRPAEKGLQPVSTKAIPAGTFISCALVNELNGEMSGPVKVQVSNDVYFPDTLDLAIPQGSVFLGEASRVSSQFQGRLAVTFDRLQITRDGRLYEIKLDKIPGLDRQGATALKDKVDNHYLQIFGVSLVIGAVGGLAQIGNGSYGGYQGYDTETQIRNGMTQTMAQTATQVLNRFLNRLPTVIIRPGTPVVVYIPFGVELQ